MSDIIKEIYKHISHEKISFASFEGANIVLYTQDRDYLRDDGNEIRNVVNLIKKRVELRADPSITIPQENAEKIIKKVIPEEAKISRIIFDPSRSRVIIEVDKPGLAIGKQGAFLKQIKDETFWTAVITRTPPVRSEIIEDIRNVLYQNSEYRREFLNKVGHRVYDGWIRERRKEWIRVSFLGGARQVGRSSLFLHTPESRVLLDAGIDVSTFGREAFPHLEAPEFKIDELDAIIVTHAHLDHCGMIPWLFKMGYKGPVYATAPTRDIMALMLLDFIKIAKNEGKDPLFTADDVKNMVLHTITLNYEEVTDITPDVRITLYNAGHTLGSAMVHLHIGNGLHNLLYTGDLKYANSYLLEAAHTDFPRLESVIIESTYGGKQNVMPSKKEVDKQLKEVIIKTIERGGKVLIPTLGTGRAQEIMIMIAMLVKKGELKEIPVYIDGLVWDVTAIHTAYPEFLNRGIRKLIFHKDDNPFLMSIFKRVGSKKERKQLIEETGPAIILATSGMLVGGPSVEYFKELATDKKNTLIFSSYQAENTLGRRILNGEREIAFKVGSNKQEIIKVNMEVFKLEITGHSDRNELMNFLHRINPRPRRVIVNHGENSRCLDLASSVHRKLKMETNVPRNLEVLRLK